MTVTLPDLKIAYHPIPKTACTSLKDMFFYYENGRTFSPLKICGRNLHIHDFYKTPLHRDKNLSSLNHLDNYVVVRDPIDRFVSCYSNRVVFHRELSREKCGDLLQEANMPYNPTLKIFVEKIEKYCELIPSIKHHARPFTDFIGADPDFYRQVFPIKHVKSFHEMIETIAGIKLPLRKLQTGGPKIDRESIAETQRKKIMQFYEADYEAYSQWF